MSSKETNVDIFQMLSERAKKRKEERARLLDSLGVREYFEAGSIRIDKRTCKGVECKMCIEACPTNALYWGYGDVKIVEDLCVYCAACVLSCIVDNCIEVTRKRAHGKVERFSNPTEVFRLLESIDFGKRLDVTKRRFPSLEKYLEELFGGFGP